uniref:Uncharacterized protein n=1 Tax=Physcomitrium patens TaxID=3218 RepID=A0A2K1K707_PHYPA|nr:hypothetical protein PHYPA_011457 [Physcomitrium patens]
MVLISSHCLVLISIHGGVYEIKTGPVYVIDSLGIEINSCPGNGTKDATCFQVHGTRLRLDALRMDHSDDPSLLLTSIQNTRLAPEKHENHPLLNKFAMADNKNLNFIKRSVDSSVFDLEFSCGCVHDSVQEVLLEHFVDLELVQEFHCSTLLRMCLKLVDLTSGFSDEEYTTEEWSSFLKVKMSVLVRLSSGSCSPERKVEVDANHDDVLGSEIKKEVECLIEQRDVLHSVLNEVWAEVACMCKILLEATDEVIFPCLCDEATIVDRMYMLAKNLRCVNKLWH